MEKNIVSIDSKKDDRKSLLIRVLVTFLCVAVFLSIVEFALYKYIVPNIAEGGTYEYNASTTSNKIYIETYIKEGETINKLFYKNENGRWLVYDGLDDGAIVSIKQVYKDADKLENFIERAPNAFELTINWVHYLVFGIIFLSFIAYYVYWFVKIDKYYAQNLKEEVKKLQSEDKKPAKTEIAKTEVKQVKTVTPAKKTSAQPAKKVAAKKTSTTKTTSKPKTTVKKG